MQVNQFVEQLAARFQQAGLEFGHGTDNALDEAVYLVYSLLEIDFTRPLAGQTRQLEPGQLRLLERYASRRIESREPVAYLVKEAWFAGYRFHCDPRALVPRSPIAELIGNQFRGVMSQPPRRVLDLCCGGGCIGLACALTLPDISCDLADLSREALDLAASNVELHGLAQRVRLIESDLFSALDGSYDLILCNPPYVSRQEYEGLPPEFHHEPRSGLVCADAGLQIPLRVLRAAADYLNPNGMLIMEVGHSQHLLSERLPDLPLMWLAFENGGEGVLALSREQLQQFCDSLN